MPDHESVASPPAPRATREPPSTLTRNTPKSMTAARELARDVKFVESLPAGAAAPVAYLSPLHMFEVERMARQGMPLSRIADRLDIDRAVFAELMRANPAIGRAFTRGAAEGIDRVTGTLYEDAATPGNTAASTAYLKLFPDFRPQQAPAVVVQSDGPLTISTANVENLAARQAALLEGSAEDITDK